MPLIVTPKTLNQRAELYHQLGIMITAGLTVHKALEHLYNNPPSYSLRQTVGEWVEQLNQGRTISEALRNIGKWIPDFDLALIEAGERSGRLDACFKLLAVYYRERAEMAQQMISDMLYPAFVFNVALVIFPFIRFVQTGSFIGFLGSVALIAIPVYGGILLAIFACQGRHGEAWRSKIEKILGCVPILGTARRQLAMARLATALESLLNAGVSIVTAWELAAAASGSPAIARTVNTWKEPVENGATYSELINKSDLFPELFANLYHTGEVSGSLDDTLRRLHVLYQTEGFRKTRAISSWTPKLVYFGVLLYGAWKVVSFYTGYFQQINDAMK